MSFTFDEFPNSDYYRSDLREILSYVRTIQATLAEYDEVIAELQAELSSIQGLYTRVDTIESAIADLSTIRSNIATLQSQITQLGNEDVALQTQINAIKASMSNIDNRFHDVYDYIDLQVAMIDSNWYSKWLQLQNLINIRYLELSQEIENLSERLEYAIEHMSYDVFNPISHTRMTFDDNNRQAYVDLRDDGMSYGELSARQFTYGYIRDAKWSHRVFSTRGRRLVTHSDTNLFSSVSGRWTNWSQALSEALGFIYNTINYGELAEQEITYAQMESLTYGDLIKVSDRSSLTYGALSQLTTNGNNLISL